MNHILTQDMEGDAHITGNLDIYELPIYEAIHVGHISSLTLVLC